MGEKEYEVLMNLLAFVKIQNDTILQLLLDKSNGYKKNAYKTVYKTMVEYWEEKINENEKRD